MSHTRVDFEEIENLSKEFMRKRYRKHEDRQALKTSLSFVTFTNCKLLDDYIILD